MLTRCNKNQEADIEHNQSSTVFLDRTLRLVSIGKCKTRRYEKHDAADDRKWKLNDKDVTTCQEPVYTKTKTMQVVM